MNFVLYDHTFYDAGTLNLTSLVLSGSIQLAQKIWFKNNELPLFSENVSLLKEQAEVLRFPLAMLLADERELLRLVKRLLNKNRYYKTGWVVLSVFTDGAGPHLLIRAVSSSGNDFPLSERGILMGYSEIIKYSGNSQASFEFFNRILWEAAISDIKGTQVHNSIILNEGGIASEAIGANIFFVKGKLLITPATETGCYLDPIRRKILEAAIELKFQVIESPAITKEQVYAMDEIFIASEGTGMEWVIGIGTKRFIHSAADKLNEKLNELLNRSVQ